MYCAIASSPPVGLGILITSVDMAMISSSRTSARTRSIILESRDDFELVDAFNRILDRVRNNGLANARVDEDMISQHLYTAGLPDPDLLIRTSGEMRVSNFLLWQIAYAEIYVTETLWPDFTRAQLLEALLDFQKRERRYGGLAETRQRVIA